LTCAPGDTREQVEAVLEIAERSLALASARTWSRGEGKDRPGSRFGFGDNTHERMRESRIQCPKLPRK
jgi:hypothetical protein